jgi:hypothetical protein
MTLGTIDLRKNPSWTLLQTVLACNVTLVKLAFSNVGNAYECTQRLLSVNAALEFDDAVTNNMRDQFDALSVQVGELSMSIPLETEDLKLSFWD